MNSAIERLLGLRVSDVMSSNVVQVNQDDRMSEAAAILDRHDVSGAPVVDDQGRCVGILSSSDFVLRSANAVDQTVEGQEVLHKDHVSDHMSEVVESVSPDSSIMDAARSMCREHIHRLVVLDDGKNPVGLVSSLDLVAAMVAAIQE